MTDRPKRGKRIQIYLPADLLERWEQTPRYERSATVATALRRYWRIEEADVQALKDSPRKAGRPKKDDQ